MDVEAEIRDLKRRVGDLEGAYSVLTGQVRDLQPDLRTFRAESLDNFERFRRVLDRVDTRLDDVGKRMQQMELQVWSIRDDLPELVREGIQTVATQKDTGRSET